GRRAPAPPARGRAQPRRDGAGHDRGRGRARRPDARSAAAPALGRVGHAALGRVARAEAARPGAPPRARALGGRGGGRGRLEEEARRRIAARMRAPWRALPRFAFATGSLHVPAYADGNGNGNGSASRFGLDQDLELHDANHVEVKRDYPVSWEGGPGSYVVETYVFLPYSFGITPDTFPAEQLFSL